MGNGLTGGGLGGSSGGGGGITLVSGTAPIAVANGSTAPVISYDGSKITSTVTSGNVAYQIEQGARIVTNGATATRYLSDNGTYMNVVGGLLISGAGATHRVINSTNSTGSYTYWENNNASAGLTIGVSGSASFPGYPANSIPFIQTGADIYVLNGSGTEVSRFGVTGTFVSQVASGSHAITLLAGARIGDGTRYISFGASGVSVAGSVALLVDNVRNATAATTLRVFGAFADGASAVAVAIDSGVAYTNATAKILSIRNNTVEKSFVDKDGGFNFGSQNTYKGTTSITAFATGGQASATQLAAEINFVTTVATTADSVKLPTAALGIRTEVFNLGANSVDIFPATGGAIDALGTNAAYALAAGASRVFCGQSATQWRSR